MCGVNSTHGLRKIVAFAITQGFGYPPLQRSSHLGKNTLIIYPSPWLYQESNDMSSYIVCVDRRVVKLMGCCE